MKGCSADMVGALRTVLALCLLLAHNVKALDAKDATPVSRVRVLTDGNFDVSTMDGKPWVLMVHSPACSHCRRMLPALEEAATALEADGVSVGKINGVENHVTSNRFHITKFPSVFFLKDGKSWEYPGPWRSKELVAFVRKGHLAAEPIPWYRNPTHAASRVYGLLLSVPSRVYDVYHHYHNEKGYSEMLLVGIGLASILAFGIVVIAALDVFYAAHPHLLHHPHHD